MKLRTECVLFAVGLAATGTAARDLTRYSLFQHDTNSARVATIPVVRWLVDGPSKTLGHLRSRRCGLNVTVVDGDDDASLSIAAGMCPELLRWVPQVIVLWLAIETRPFDACQKFESAIGSK